MFAVNVGVVGRPRVVDGDAAEAGQHAEVVDAFRAALGVTGDKGVLVGAGAVHPVQLARHSQPGLVETHHLGAGELVTHVGQKPVEAPGGPLGERGDGTTRQWGAEQFGQGLGGAFLGQELPDVQIHHDRGDPRPVLHRGVHPGRCLTPGALPAHAFPLHQLVLGHLDAYRRQVELLAPLHGGDRPACQRTPATGARPRFVYHLVFWLGHLPKRRPVVAVLPTRLTAGLLTQRPHTTGAADRSAQTDTTTRTPQPLTPQGTRRVTHNSDREQRSPRRDQLPRVFVNDVGQNTTEEVDELQAGGNYGWPMCEGACNTTGLIDPIFQYSHNLSGGRASIVGGAFGPNNAWSSLYTGSYAHTRSRRRPGGPRRSDLHSGQRRLAHRLNRGRSAAGPGITAHTGDRLRR